MSEREPMWVHCADCSHEWVCAYLPMPIAKLAPLMKAPCPMCGGKKPFLGKLPRETSDGDADAWIANGDTGVSSETIWSVLTGHPVRSTGVPFDPSDFGRCYRLLKVMPSWRGRLSEVVAKHPRWSTLVAHWDELTALYEEESPSGTAPKLYARMVALLGT